jgi:uncharacterized LabA/DUF88 family protein
MERLSRKSAKIQEMRKKKKRILKKKSRNIFQELINKIEGRVAVYIDAANLEKSVQELGQIPPKYIPKGGSWKTNKNLWYVDYKKLYQFFKKSTNLESISFYTARFATKSHDKFLNFLKKNGYRIIVKPIKTISGRGRVITCEKCGYKNKIADERKADFDVEISVDATYWMKNYDTLILFSGDSDFLYLLEFLKKYGKKTIVLSRRGHVANELRTSRKVDYYQDIWKLKDKFLRRVS